MGENEVGRHEYSAYKRAVDQRLGKLEKDMDTAFGDIRKLPSRDEIKKDLDHQTVILTHSIANIQTGIKDEKDREKKAAEEKEKKAVAFRWKVGIAVGIGGPLFILGLNILAKRAGLL